MTTNDCLVEPLLDNFVSCNVFNFPRAPPCEGEFDNLMTDVDIGKCFGSLIEDGIGSLVGGVKDDSESMNAFNNASKSTKLDAVSCLVQEIVPKDFVTEISK